MYFVHKTPMIHIEKLHAFCIFTPFFFQRNHSRYRFLKSGEACSCFAFKSSTVSSLLSSSGLSTSISPCSSLFESFWAACFSKTDTYEYRAEPIRTTRIPKPFIRVIGVAKIIVEMAIIRTCFTFAAMLR